MTYAALPAARPGAHEPSPVRRLTWTGILAAFLLACALTAPARFAAAQTPNPVSLEISLFRLPLSESPYALTAVIWLTPEKGWYAYSHTPGETGQPLSAAFSLTPGGEPLPVYYPEGERKPDNFEPDKIAVIYGERTPIFTLIPDLGGKEAMLSGRITVFLCSATSCWPVSLEPKYPLDPADAAEAPLAEDQPWWGEFLAAKKLALNEKTSAPPPSPAGASPAPVAAPETTPAAKTASEASPDWGAVLAPRFASPSLEVSGMAKAALLAMLAGFILNFMPCVLPVISLKLSSLLAVCAACDAKTKRTALRRHNVFFALGILAYFAALSLILGFAGLAWGEIFQKPGLVLALTAVLFALAMSMFGVFHLPVIDLRIAEKAHNGADPAKGAFLTGVLATLLATPCSGPFLGGVLAWALLQPIPVIVTIFLFIGLGMAAPYILLAVFPRLVRLMPRPGPWMRKLETLMGFVLAATCVYFLTILPQHLLIPSLFALLATAFAAWIWGGWTTLSQARSTRVGLRLLAACLAASAVVWAANLPPPDDAGWVPYDQQAFSELRGKQNILVDFTADWCPTCKFLEKTVLTRANTDAWSEDYDLTLIRADLTEKDPEAMRLLRALGSQSIPLVALFPKGEHKNAPVVLRDLFTKSQIEEALRQAFD